MQSQTLGATDESIASAHTLQTFEAEGTTLHTLKSYIKNEEEHKAKQETLDESEVMRQDGGGDPFSELIKRGGEVSCQCHGEH